MRAGNAASIPTIVIALLTVNLAISQCAGPLLGGSVSDTQLLGGDLLRSGAILALASLIAPAQRTPDQPARYQRYVYVTLIIDPMSRTGLVGSSGPNTPSKGADVDV